jgi:hypothetical protein
MGKLAPAGQAQACRISNGCVASQAFRRRYKIYDCPPSILENRFHHCIIT